jgi:hypothetical protein
MVPVTFSAQMKTNSNVVKLKVTKRHSFSKKMHGRLCMQNKKLISCHGSWQHHNRQFAFTFTLF